MLQSRVAKENGQMRQSGFLVNCFVPDFLLYGQSLILLVAKKKTFLDWDSFPRFSLGTHAAQCYKVDQPRKVSTWWNFVFL